MRNLAAYVHTLPAAGDTEEADPRPGSYYVSCIDGPRRALLYGPLASHAAALAMVERSISLQLPLYMCL